MDGGRAVLIVVRCTPSFLVVVAGPCVHQASALKIAGAYV